MEKSKAGTKNEAPKASTIGQAYLPTGSQRHETVDEFSN